CTRDFSSWDYSQFDVW
nr:immunoglobulin heavy chain junction region [Macaca mulatta]MOW24795.1 immunoglobulin heavy chain junction region [Macaca mulatta]